MNNDVKSALFIYMLISERQKIIEKPCHERKELFSTHITKKGQPINIGLFYLKFGVGKTLAKPKVFYYSLETKFLSQSA